MPILPAIRKSVMLLVVLILPVSVRAGQFLGGEISYRFISRSGNDFVYEITFKLYRDCFTLAELDDPVIEYINTTDISHNTHLLFYRKITMVNPVITNLPYSSKSYCAINDPVECIEMRVYTTQITVPYSPEGYTFYYSNCCRNGLSNLRLDEGNFGTETILNVPVGGQALTYTARIPSHDSLEQNSSPFTISDSVIYACKGKPMEYRFQLNDPDGDSLSYKLAPSLAKVPAATTNFYPILFNPGYTIDKPAAGGPPLMLDPLTGIFSGIPDRLGFFALAIVIEEFRNGKLINKSRKDYQVNVKDCDIKKPPDIVNCADHNIFFTNPNSGANNFLWDFGVTSVTTDISTDGAPYYLYPETGTFTVKLVVSNPAGCKDSVYSEVKIYPGLIPNFEWTGQQCAGNPVVFKDRTNPPFGNMNGWTWRVMNNNRVVSTASSFSYTHPVSGTMPYPLAMRLTVSSDLGCKDSVMKDILIYENVKADAGPDRILAFNQPYQLQAGNTAVGAIYTWSPSFGLSNPSVSNPVVTANRNITYTLTVGNEAGCTSTDVVSFKYMKGPDIYVPTAFTPNNDGLNDMLYFYPAGMDIASFSIYNRWGEMIFSSSDINKGWDGKIKGLLQDTGIYIWMVSAKDFDGKTVFKKGTVTLIR